MTSEEKMREEFEEWAKSHGYEIDIDKSGFYALHETESGWEAWKASRESLVIRVNSAACHDAAAGDVLDAIESSGIKWEVEQ